ncbi:uncharacterized protein RCC_03211 [Ramularia collo-cygni]|uniref:Essential protein Yae1 N-terminal domain-containing protein n=1 Tax=Ramularia collo-cygni TaxID=112498 RepID=A0A2D3UYI1_9PEZI|nr:uncharacterized protein RCC_03211 [Ramularia collo-cygni]CZT17377.1 uncharacterized protein RCC_03211 [Ramularia collo-cygni]
MSTSIDLFPEILNLEDQFFQEGYVLGVADGQKSGRIEGRIFGLEKGFSKAIEMGRLNGKACVWEARTNCVSDEGSEGVMLTPLNGNERLKKHIQRLVTLSDPEGLSLENGEEEVSEFDDRLKDAKAKAVIVERIVGEGEGFGEGEGVAAAASSTQQRKVPVRVRRGEKVGVAGKSTGEMEDFVGMKGLRGS